MLTLLLLVVAYYAVLFGVSTHAFLYGSASERLGAVVAIAATAASVLIGRMAGTTWMGRRVPLLLIDSMALLAFVWIAFRSRSFWPLWASGLQLSAVATHIAALTENPAAASAYKFVQGFWAYPILFALLLGSMRNRRLVKHYGRAWFALRKH